MKNARLSPEATLRKVESFLRRTDMPVTTFGRKVAGDPRLVLDLRHGRGRALGLTSKLVDDIAGFIDEWDEQRYVRRHIETKPRRKSGASHLQKIGVH